MNDLTMKAEPHRNDQPEPASEALPGVGSSAGLGGLAKEHVIAYLEDALKSSDVRVYVEYDHPTPRQIDVLAQIQGRLLLISAEALSLEGLPEDQHCELRKRARAAQLSRVTAHSLLHPQPKEFRLREQQEECLSAYRVNSPNDES